MQLRRSFDRTLITTAVSMAMVISVVACGGGSGAASSAPGASVAATTVPAVSAPPTEPAASTPPSAAPSTAAGGGGGGAAGLACDLLTAAEASGVIGGGTYTTESIPGDPSYCSYKAADGSIKAMTSLAQKDGKAGYDAWASASDSVKVDGLGDGAVWVPSLATLLILKGGTVYGITAGTGQDDESKRIDWSKALGAIAVTKM